MEVLIISRSINGNDALPAPAAVHICSCPSQYLHGDNLFGVKITCNPVKISSSWIAIYNKQWLFPAILIQRTGGPDDYSGIFLFSPQVNPVRPFKVLPQR